MAWIAQRPGVASTLLHVGKIAQPHDTSRRWICVTQPLIWQALTKSMHPSRGCCTACSHHRSDSTPCSAAALCAHRVRRHPISQNWSGEGPHQTATPFPLATKAATGGGARTPLLSPATAAWRVVGCLLFGEVAKSTLILRGAGGWESQTRWTSDGPSAGFGAEDRPARPAHARLRFLARRGRTRQSLRGLPPLQRLCA